MAELKPLSLHDACRNTGFEVAVLATYNINFPYFEDVILRALQSGGCRQIIVLADAGQVGAAFEHRERRPTRAGREYLLVPVTRARTFHPKLLLQLGRNKTRLIVGSHNLTFAGYGRNIELSTSIEIDRRERPERALVQTAWSFLREWIDDLPAAVLDMFDAARATAGNTWIGSGSPSALAAAISLLGSSRTGPSLFTQLRDVLPGPSSRISVLGPYFDDDLALVGKLRDLEGQPEIVVVVDPDQAELPSSARALGWARFVDLRQAKVGPSRGDGSPFVHAKALVFEHRDGTKTLVTGSANPSRAAWLLAAPRRNAELVVVERNAEMRVTALGLHALTSLPELDDSAWDTLAKREQARTAEATTQPPGPGPAILAWLDHATVTISASFVTHAEPLHLEFLDEHDLVLAQAVAIETDQHFARVTFDDTATTGEVACLRNVVSGQRALIQHQAELHGRASGSQRQQFKAALLGLETDGTRLDELFKLVSKLLEEPVITSEIKVAAKPSSDTDPTTSRPIATFEGSIYDGSKPRTIPRGQRALAPSSDLAAIIEFLIYQLGVGRSADVEHENADTITGEEDLTDLERDGVDLPNEEDEDGPPPTQGHEPLSGRERAKLCQRKIRTLLQRLLTRVDELGEADPVPSIVHTVVVLGLLRHLRLAESAFAWRPRNESVLPARSLHEFFAKMCPRLYAPQTGLVDRALAGQGGRAFDELSSLHALMSWMAADRGVDLASLDRLDIYGKDVEQGWIALGRALGPLTACAEDDNARALANGLATMRAPTQAWLGRHLAWTRPSSASGDVRAGSLVSVPRGLRRHVVVAVEPKKVRVYVLAKDRVVAYRRDVVTP